LVDQHPPVAWKSRRASGFAQADSNLENVAQMNRLWQFVRSAIFI